MTDELELLRGADPVSAETGPWRDRPLDARAELLLTRLPARERRRRTVRRTVLAVAGAAAATAVALALTVSGGGSTPAVAVPRPLVAHASRADVPLAEIARRARAAAEAAPGRSVRGSHVQTWSMGMETGKGARPPVTTPVESLTTWNADGSGTLLQVATDPRHPGRPVIDGGPPPRTVHDGKVLNREHYPKGTYGANQEYVEAPPAGVSELRAYLAAWLPGADKDPVSLLSAIESFQTVWTPGPRQIADIATLLSRLEGRMHPAGRVTDRLGREGQGFRMSGINGGRYLVVLDPDDGRLLDLELTATRAEPDFQLKAGSVMSYTAWRG
ncbi:CU044_5270 family protein [Streptomyces sp. NA02950]|uniref:CU044_5270 family protein n=1 Tax=Streptomyces sp. NA02950 TaxID=2742137 RepID=UPI001590657F|nr:CU044_5270 family protein [Streptomyces sp. NA02950]QKV90987.1 CU044_5270 family protein [Streptomyces sp. NA02950]